MKRVKRGVSNSSPPPFPRKNYPQKAQPYYGEIALPKKFIDSFMENKFKAADPRIEKNGQF